MNDDFHLSDELPVALSLEQVQQRFESWRQRRKKRSPIPQSLWKAAVSLSHEYSICHLSKALRLNYTALKKQIIKSKNTEPSPPDTFYSPFIELPAPTACLTESNIEMIKSDGSVMKMQIKGVNCPDWVALGKAFWTADS